MCVQYVNMYACECFFTLELPQGVDNTVHVVSLRMESVELPGDDTAWHFERVDRGRGPGYTFQMFKDPQ